jgi:hypothetical protein
MGETSTLLVPVERADLNDWPNIVGVSHSSEDGTRCNFNSETTCSLDFWNTALWTKLKNPVIPRRYVKIISQGIYEYRTLNEMVCRIVKHLM